MKLLGIVVLVPIAFALQGFAGAILGFVVADALRYMAFGMAARRRGLRSLSSDLLLSALVGLAAAGGLDVDGVMTANGTAGLLRICGSAATAAALWLALSHAILRPDLTSIAAALRSSDR